jgi:hypothetical protein
MKRWCLCLLAGSDLAARGRKLALSGPAMVFAVVNVSLWLRVVRTLWAQLALSSPLSLFGVADRGRRSRLKIKWER